MVGQLKKHTKVCRNDSNYVNLFYTPHLFSRFFSFDDNEHHRISNTVLLR